MPHFKCVPCKTRLYRPAGEAERVGDLCPDCGSLLEPVGQLSEVLGFRSIRSRDAGPEGGTGGTHQRMAGRIGNLVARRAAIRARDRLEAERWLDDGGSSSPEAVAEALALPRPEQKS